METKHLSTRKLNYITRRLESLREGVEAKGLNYSYHIRFYGWGDCVAAYVDDGKGENTLASVHDTAVNEERSWEGFKSLLDKFEREVKALNASAEAAEGVGVNQ